jgi:hypothetical protein
MSNILSIKSIVIISKVVTCKVIISIVVVSFSSIVSEREKKVF